MNHMEVWEILAIVEADELIRASLEPQQTKLTTSRSWALSSAARRKKSLTSNNSSISITSLTISNSNSSTTKLSFRKISPKYSNKGSILAV